MKGNKLIVNKIQFLFLILLLESILLFLVAPSGHSYWFSWLCMVQFVISAIVYVAVQKKKNYFDFDIVFLLTFYFIMFVFPVFMYGTDVEKIFFAFRYDYNVEVISRATALSLLGGQAYMFGGLMVNNDKICIKKSIPMKVIPNEILTFGVLVCFALFFVAVGPELFTHNYDGKLGGESASGAVTYILVLLSALFISDMSIEFNNWAVDKKYNKSYFLFFLMILYVGVFLAVGSRTTPLQFGLLCVGLFAVKVKPIKFRWMVLMVVAGVVMMGAFGMMRSQNTQAKENMKEQAGALIFLQDLVLNNRNTFMAVDMVDRYGIDYGQGMMTNVFGVIPFANSMILNTTPLTELDMSSGLRITAESLGVKSGFSVGFGTNIIASVYMSFGMVGVVIFLFALGYIVKYAMLRAIYQNNIYYLLFYAVMMSYSVFLVRSEFFIFLRFWIWGFIITNIIKLYPYKLVFNIKK